MCMKILPRISLVLALLLPSLAHADVSEEVTQLTGAHTRLVWIRDAGEISDPLAERNTSMLMGFDNRDGKGERAILPTAGSYYQPLITPDGQQVAFGNKVDHKIYLVNWDGSNLRPVIENASLADVWTDPATGKLWIYANVTEEAATGADGVAKQHSIIRRYLVEDPKVNEVVWSKSAASAFQVSPSGTFASGSSGDGEGMFTLPDGKFDKFYGGCWPSIAPDGSPRLWVFTGSHKGAHIFTCNTKNNKRSGQYAAFINAPGVPSSHEVYHPRWSNHTRFLTVTGPYWYKDWHWKEDHKLSVEAAAKAEIYLGRFNSDLEFVEKWVKISTNDKGDFFGDAWIDLKEKPLPEWKMPADLTGEPVQVAEWPGNQEGMVFRWENNTANNQIEDPVTKKLDLCNLVPRGQAVWGRYNVMDTGGGSFVAEEGRNTAILKAALETNQFTLEAVLSPASLNQSGVFPISFGNNFALEQNGNQMVMWLKTSGTGGKPARIQLGEFIAKSREGAPLLDRIHVIVTYTSGVLTFYVNGAQRSMKDGIGGNLSVWEPAQLVFGDSAQGGKPWRGAIESVTFANRRLAVGEAKDRMVSMKARLKDRKTLEPIVVKAKLVETTAAPSPDSITPYRRCLSVNVYEVESVEKGQLADKRIMVAEWSVLDAQKVPGFLELKKDETYTLNLEPYDQHAELESERMVTDMSEDYPLFYSPKR